MRNGHNGLKRFFIVCGVVCCLGLLMVVIGYFTGGMRGMNDMDQRYDWIKVGDAEMTSLSLGETAGENVGFDSVRVTGDMDVNFISGEKSETTLTYDKTSQQPVFEIQDGVLMVDAREINDTTLINLGSGDRTPYLTVCVPEGEELDSVDIDTSYGDIDMDGISMKTADISAGYGDIHMNRVSYGNMEITAGYGDVDGTSVVSGGLIIRADSGNVDLRGEFSGETDIAVDYGDVDMQTSLTEDMYSFDVNVDYGDLRIGANSYGDSGRIRQGNGAHLIKIVSDAGDVAIDFGR